MTPDAPVAARSLREPSVPSGVLPGPIPSFIERILRSEKLGDDVVHVASIAAQEASHALLSAPLPVPLQQALCDLGIDRLFSHQAEAIDAARSGRDVLTVTPTASGKSLVYLLPTLEAALTRPGARALYLFPYKALAQDQLQGIVELAGATARHGGVVRGGHGLPGTGRPVSAAIYDGDTPDSRRRKIKAEPPDILITNPDMLHLGILAHHQDWRALFENLDAVVVDELHVYRGIFGSHLHHVLKRLLRIAANYGSRPRFIASSATIANPGGLGEALFGRPFLVVDRTGAPRAGRHLMFVNPLGGSPYTAATQLFAWALDAGFRTIAFTKARKITELLHSWLLQSAPRYASRVSAYRSGYLPEERREIERRLHDGSLQGVISTSALELGVDIGGLDVCILVGYPGSVVSTWQRIGRVGREDRPSLTVLVGMPDALDQYFMANPDELLNRGFEEVVFDPGNRVIARAHMLCAGAELGLEQPRDRELYGEMFGLVEELEREGALARDAGGERWYTLRRRPQRDVSLRTIGATYTIVDVGADRVIGTLDAVRAFHETHAGAIYLHHAQQYLVRDLDIEARRVSVVPVDVDYYTEVRGEKETEVLEVLDRKQEGALAASLGRLEVTEELSGFEKRRLFGRDRLGLFDLSLPPLTFETVGLWITLPDAIRDSVVESEGHFMGGIHALEHALISLFPLMAICDRGDIGGISYPLHPQIGRSAIFIYDGYPGGCGLAAKGFAGLGDLLKKTAALLRDCACPSGCPSCIQSPKCGNGNHPLDKAAALQIAVALGDRAAGTEMQAAGPILPARPRPEPLPPRPPLRLMGGGFDHEPLPTPVRRGSSGGSPAGELTLFLDVETQRSAEEVGGWQNIPDMKLALAVTYNQVNSEFKTHFEKDVDRLLLDLAMADKVIGYNIDRFDLLVLKGYTPWNLTRIRTFDMLADIYRKLGFRLKLGDLAEATLGVGKSGDGLQSLKWWKEGRLDLIEQYCRHDVEVTRDVYVFGQRNGYVLYRDRDGRPLRLPVEWK
ncbi:MAG TPA: DEAD/DEAH box helicase [Candidatus Polarisedimenticolia bacterium]|jgi:DEAD/DEAH box helicase domain-containing protein|nr:DEAD/DEAH box helicase [Candidatus Polarisedimenticolia bacterium]